MIDRSLYESTVPHEAIQQGHMQEKKSSFFVAIKKVLITVATLFIVYTGFASVKFLIEANMATPRAVVRGIMHSKNKMVVIYNPKCKNCLKSVPIMFWKYAWSPKGEIVIDINKLLPEDREYIGLKETPAFFYKGKSVQGIRDWNKIEKIWKDSH